MRVRLDLSYQGAPFHGWARQPGLLTVCGTVEAALATIFREPVELTVAGRTDTGVHATAQVAHFDVATDVLARALLKSHKDPSVAAVPSELIEAVGLLPSRLNGLIAHSLRILPAGVQAGSAVVIRSATVVDSAFDARFSARMRHYCYRIADQLDSFDPRTAAYTWWVDRPLDIAAMTQAGQILTGEHDFLSLCKPREGATTVRTLTRVRIARSSDVLTVTVSADAFCHSMVRSLVGALTEVGWGRRDLGWVKTLLREPARQHGVPVAPAHGLTLVGVEYPPPEQWKIQQVRTRRVRNSPLNEVSL